MVLVQEARMDMPIGWRPRPHHEERAIETTDGEGYVGVNDRGNVFVGGTAMEHFSPPIPGVRDAAVVRAPLAQAIAYVLLLQRVPGLTATRGAPRPTLFDRFAHVRELLAQAVFLIRGAQGRTPVDGEPWVEPDELLHEASRLDLEGPACRVCGCTQHDPCPEGCGWYQADLCTSCAVPDRADLDEVADLVASLRADADAGKMLGPENQRAIAEQLEQLAAELAAERAGFTPSTGEE
jgi:hypothetical protein